MLREKHGGQSADGPNSPARNIARILRPLPALLYMALIFYVSSQPRVPVAGSDKALHFLAYGLLAVLLLYALRPSISGPRALLLSLVISVLYGCSDEWHQSFVPGRSAEIADAMADAAGNLAALMLIAAWKRLRTRFAGNRNCRSGP